MTDFEVLSNKHTARLHNPLKCIDFGFSQDNIFKLLKSFRIKQNYIILQTTSSFTAQKEKRENTQTFSPKLDIISQNAKKLHVFFSSFKFHLFDK